jgi:hypothetical protein
MPPAAKKVPKYETPGRATGSWLVRRMMYPIMANAAEPITKGALLLSLSETMATDKVVTNAKAYGGIVSNCAFAAVYPRFLMMLGCQVRLVYCLVPSCSPMASRAFN